MFKHYGRKECGVRDARRRCRNGEVGNKMGKRKFGEKEIILMLRYRDELWCTEDTEQVVNID